MSEALLKENIEDVYPMSDIEKGMVYHSLKNSDKSVYHNQTVFQRQVYEFSPEIFKKAVVLLVAKHPILRTGFDINSSDEPLQVVYKTIQTDIHHYDISHLDRAEQEDYVKQKMVEDKQNHFDIMNSESLWRMKTFSLDKENICFLWSCHHAVMDGWSLASLMTELNNTYLELKSNPSFVPVKLKMSYKEFVIEQIIEKENSDTIAYWQKELDGYKRFELPTAAGNKREPVEPGGSVEKKVYSADFGKPLLDELRCAAVTYETNVKHLCFAAYINMLNMLSYEGDIVAGLVTNNRPVCEDGEKIIGCFLNTVPVRVTIPTGITWSDYVRVVDGKLKELVKYGRLSLFEIARIIGEEVQDQNPIFDTLFNFVDFFVYGELNQDEFQEGQENPSTPRLSLGMREVTNTLLDFTVDITSGSLTIGLSYSNALINDEMLRKCCGYFETILDKFIYDPGNIIKKDELMSLAEKHKLLYELYETAADYPKDMTIHHLFANQVERTPGNTGVVCKGYHLTYGELNRRANRLAVFLIEKGVFPASIVGIIVEPSAEMIIGILGILKAGAAYLPIDVEYPEERIAYLLEDANVSVILTNTKQMQQMNFTGVHGIQFIKTEPYKTDTRLQISDFDSLPIPDRSLVNYEKYHQFIGQAMVKHCIDLQATRGCPYDCAYCHRIWPKKHVARSAGNVFKEIQVYYNMGIRRFSFIDDIFNFDKKNSARLFELIIEKKLDIQLFFPNGLRGDVLTDDYIDLMVRAGTVSMALALESAAPRIQKLIGKNLDLNKLKENIEYICEKYPHVILELFLMHGFPTETEEEAKQTLDFVKELRWVHFPYFHILKVYPHTDMEKIALDSGISKEAISRSLNSAFHELSDTLPFKKSFTLECQSELLNEYFLLKERLVNVLPYQMKVLTEDEMVQKYNSYLPVEVNSFLDFLKFIGIKKEELGTRGFADEESFRVPRINDKMKKYFTGSAIDVDALRILLLDLSLLFTKESSKLYDVIEPPLGLLNILTYLNKKLPGKINGKIAKSRIDFDSYEELENLLDEFKPDMIGIRTLTLYKDFFHRTVNMLRKFGNTVPIISGGPYATSDYAAVLQNCNIDLVVIGEGEVTFMELIAKIIENNGELPDDSILKRIPGIAFVPGRKKNRTEFAREIVLLDEFQGKLPGEPGQNLVNINKPGDLSYVIYTSGTTGKPKGAVIEHRNVVQLMFNEQFPFAFSCDDVWTMFHSFCFDFSVWEIYGALLYGGKLILVSRLLARDTEKYLEILRAEKVTVLNQTPTAFYNLSEVETSYKERALRIRYVIFGGEILDPHRLKAWRDKYPGTKLINMYGITETTVHVTYKEISDEDISRGISNIGKALATLSTCVVDSNLKLVPIGVPGELCIGGEGLCRGYLNRAELTGEKFIENPYKPTERMYRSGDLALVLGNGELAYLGRIDDQVKIRGFRIELGEIECQLRKYKGIKEALVVAREDESTTKHLCAYIVSDKEQDESALRDYLSGILPGYMVPSYFVQIGSIPVTPNGKVDKKILPTPAREPGEAYAAPRNEIEKMLTAVWSQVLGIEKVGINDNFFMLGGDSIKMIQISSRMRKSGCKLEVRDLFSYPTISALSAHVKKFERVSDQSEVTGLVPLTPIQKEFFASQKADEHYFNQAVMLYSAGGFSEEVITAVFTKLQSHHDALRMTYKRDKKGVVKQWNHGIHYPLSLQVFDYRGKQEVKELVADKCSEIQSGIDLEKGPLMKLGLFHVDDGDHLLIVIHHLVVDGVSWRILFEDIETLYKHYVAGEALTLPLKTDSFKLWSEQLLSFSNSKLFLKEKAYWESLDTCVVPPVRKDEEGSNKIKDTRTISFSLDEGETGKLLTKVNKAFNTEINDILLTGLGLGIKESMGCEKVLIALEGHGREDILTDMDISRTIGWFTSIYPVILDVSYKGNLSRQIKEVKEALHQVPNKGIGYGILRYLTDEEHKEGIRFTLSPRLSFNYLGQFDADVAGRESFSISGFSTGKTASPELERDYELDIVGMVSNGRLFMSVTYSTKQYEEETIVFLMDKYKESLRRVISYCASREEQEITPCDLTYKQLTIDRLDQLMADCSLEDIYPLSPMQSSMLFQSLLDENSLTYFEQIAYRLQGELNIPLVKDSINELLKRYDILRTVFIYEGMDAPLQLVLKAREIDFRYEDIRGKENKEAYVSFFKEKDKWRTFDLTNDVLMRVAILRVNDNEYEYIWSSHHILMDGWCISILITEFLEIYNSYLNNEEYQLPAVKQYRAYINWLEARDQEESREYWRRYLQGYEEVSGISVMSSRKPVGDGYINAAIKFEIEEESRHGLNNLAERDNVTLNTVIQAIWGILLGKYNNSHDVVFGTVVSGRPSELDGIEAMVGLFINTIPVRMQYKDETRAAALFREVQALALKSEPHHYLALADIQSESVLKQRLLDHIMVFENYPVADHIAEVGKTWKKNSKKLRLRFEISNIELFEQLSYDFSIIVLPGKEFVIELKYNAAVHNRDTVLRTANHFKQLVSEVIENPGVSLDELSMLSEQEKEMLLIHFKNTGADYPVNRTIYDLFEEQVDKNPGRIAVVGPPAFIDSSATGYANDISLSYRELNDRANQLAGVLRETGVEQNTIVGLLIERSIEMMVGIFAILKAGAAYLPIGAEYPAARINYILADSNTKTLLTTNNVYNEVKQLISWEVDTIFLEEDVSKNDVSGIREQQCKGESLCSSAGQDAEEVEKFRSLDFEKDRKRNLSSLSLTFNPSTHQLLNSFTSQPLSSSENLAYIIYTSGTTGNPKGVMIENRNVVQLMFNDRFSFDFDCNDVWTMFHSFCFDFSVWEMYGALLFGGKLIIIPALTAKDTERFLKILKLKKVTVLNQTPTAFYNLLKYEFLNKAKDLQIRYIIFGGEALNLLKLSKWKNKYPQTKLINMYGITETTVHVTYKEITGEDIERGMNVIGKGLPTMSTYVMDRNCNPMPIGIPGELFIGGDGVCRGYLGQVELTADKFINNPYEEGKLLYRSGDLARVMENGELEYLGRIDEQVQVRGFRVELGEIENRLLKFHAIKEAVVLAKEEEDGGIYLCAYYISNVRLSTQELREYLTSSIPGYMIPAYFVQIESIPLTPNGKIDRRALPGPEIEAGEEYEAPRDKYEEKLTQLWSEILGIEVENIGINNNFFEMGGHSLRATILTARIHKEFNVKIRLGQMFVHPTIAGLARLIKEGSREEYYDIKPREKKEFYPLSSAQKRLYILQQMEFNNTGYNLTGVMELGETVEIAKIERTFKRIIKRHESLRTCFEMVNGEPVQRIYGEVDLKIEYHNFEAGSIEPEEIRRKAGEIIGNFARPFDLSKAPLLRVGVIRTGVSNPVLLFDLHHIITDGTSQQVLEEEFSSLYRGETLPLLKLHYKDFAAWQNKGLQQELLCRQETYWLNLFPEELPVLNLPTDYPRPLIQDFEGASVGFVLTEQETRIIKDTANESQATLFMVILAIYNVLLARLSGHEDIIVGTPIAGRRHADLEQIIGMFVNTLALRNSPVGEKSFREFLEEVKQSTLAAYENQEYQFEELVDKLDVRRDAGRNPVFDVMLNLLNQAEYRGEFPGEEERVYSHIKGQSKFDLTLTVVDYGKNLYLNFEYCTKLFRPETIESFIEYFKNIFNKLTGDVDRELSKIGIITGEEKKQILLDFNKTLSEYPLDKTIHKLFEEQVERTPDNTAVIYKGSWCEEFISYKKLNEKSDRLANLLRSRRVKREAIIGIMVERSIEMIVGIFGILKAGAAYLPITPDDPDERIRDVLKDSDAELLLSRGEYFARLKAKGSPGIIDLDNLELYIGHSDNSRYKNSSTGLVYVIYTSGSTGKPKGVMIEHCSLVNRLNWMQKKYPLDRDDTLLQKTPYTFDVSVWEIFWWSIVGARLCLLVPGAEKDPGLIIDTVEKNRVTVMHFVPSMLSVFLDYIETVKEIKKLAVLRQVIASGEALNLPLVKRFKDLLYEANTTRLANLYGPTEATIDVSYYDCIVSENLNTIPIGKPIDNIRLYILDKNLQLQSIGIAGELCIAGVGLARGYLNRPESTSEKFIASSFITHHLDLLYKTGDLARWLADGNIEFLGRIDHQVKIRGFRIEIGEIENQLLKIDYVKECVVIDREKDGEKYLCAYMVSSREVDTSETRSFLARVLPGYMIPSYFVQIESIPLTPNGKIDSRSLPEPGIESGEEYKAPRDKDEEKLAQLWSEILGIEKDVISINSNFFDLGGHSLKATTLVAKIYKEFNVKVPLSEMFKIPNLRDLARYIKGLAKEKYLMIYPGEKKEYYPVTSDQKRTYMMDMLGNGSSPFFMSNSVTIYDKLDKNRLESIFAALIKRHDVFRTSFELREETLVQVIHETFDFRIKFVETRGEEVGNIIKKFSEPFDLTKIPLLRVMVVSVTTELHILVYNMHHIISDGVSMAILLNEFECLGEGMELPPLKIQYKDFSVWQNKLTGSDEIKKQETYWLDLFAGDIPVLDMPTDFPRPAIKDFAAAEVNYTLEEELSRKLNRLARDTESTLFMVILTIYFILLAKYTGQEDIIIGTTAAGRNHFDLENLIGLLIKTLAIRGFPDEEKNFTQFLHVVKSTVLDAFENQDYPFKELLDNIRFDNDLSRNPLFDVMLLVQNIDRRGKNLAGTGRYNRQANLEEVKKSIKEKSSAEIEKIDIVRSVESPVDILLNVWEGGERIIFNLNYCIKLFKKETMERFLKYFIEIISLVTDENNIKLKDIKISHDFGTAGSDIVQHEETDFIFSG